MLLGRIVGRITPSRFSFAVSGDAKQFEYVQVYHKEYEWVLGQIVELVKDESGMLAKCVVIGYNDKDGKVKSIRSPFEPDSEVLRAEDNFLRRIVRLGDNQTGALVGRLEGRPVNVVLDLSKLLTKHVAVLAKTGAGKSYTVGVLLEEILEHGVPLLIIDPHGEYSSLRKKNLDEKDRIKLSMFGLEPKSYRSVVEYGDQTVNESVLPLLLDENIEVPDLIHMLPAKISGTQLGLLHSALKRIQGSPGRPGGSAGNEISEGASEEGRRKEKVDFDSVLAALSIEENNAKWTLIAHIEHLKRTGIFSPAAPDYSSMIVPGRAAILNLRGISPDIQEIIVYKVLKDLFELRKKNRVPPFFTVIEEAHNFCPERSFGEAKSSRVLRTVASEGRKFGMGLCIVSQRPARIDKSVLSQCTTQIIMKVTNPNDLKAIVSSVEGITSESEREIQSLPVGSALVAGVVDLPLFVEIRPRRTSHGGTTTRIIEEKNSSDNDAAGIDENGHARKPGQEAESGRNEEAEPSGADGNAQGTDGSGPGSEGEETDILGKLEEFGRKEILPVIKPKISPDDILLMSEVPVKKIETLLVPALRVNCRSGSRTFSLAFELLDGAIVTNIEKKRIEKKFLPPLFRLNRSELLVLEHAVRFRGFSLDEISKVMKDTVPDLSSVLDSLADNELLEKNGNLFEVSGKFVFSTLDKLHFPYRVEYQQISYDEKLKPAVSKDSLLNELARFTEIIDAQDCWIVHYAVEYEDD